MDAGPDGGVDATVDVEPFDGPTPDAEAADGGIDVGPQCTIREAYEDLAVFVVDPAAGDDDNDGSEVSPWQSVEHALLTVEEGSLILLREGTYTVSPTAGTPAFDRPNWVPENNGSEGRPIVLANYPCETVTIVRGDVSGPLVGGDSGTHHFWIDGLTIDNEYSGGTPVLFYGAAAVGNRVRHCTVRNVMARGAGSTANTTAIRFEGQVGGAVEFNDVSQVGYENGAEGHNSTLILQYVGEDNDIRYNVFHDSPSMGFRVKNWTKNVRVYRNIFVNVGNQNVPLDGAVREFTSGAYSAGYGVFIGDGDADTPYDEGWYVYENLFMIDEYEIQSAAIQVVEDDQLYVADGVEVYNNTIDAPTCFGNGDYDRITGLRFFNNVCRGRGNLVNHNRSTLHGLGHNPDSILVHDFNCWFEREGGEPGVYYDEADRSWSFWTTNATYATLAPFDVHSVVAEPSFVGEGNYALSSESPCRGVGREGGVGEGAPMDAGAFTNEDWTNRAGPHPM